MIASNRTVDFDDGPIDGPGAVGVETRADSVTAFDDFVHARRAPDRAG